MNDSKKFFNPVRNIKSKISECNNQIKNLENQLNEEQNEKKELSLHEQLNEVRNEKKELSLELKKIMEQRAEIANKRKEKFDKTEKFYGKVWVVVKQGIM